MYLVERYRCVILKTHEIVELRFNDSHLAELYSPLWDKRDPVRLTLKEALILVNKWNKASDKLKYWID